LQLDSTPALRLELQSKHIGSSAKQLLATNSTINKGPRIADKASSGGDGGDG